MPFKNGRYRIGTFYRILGHGLLIFPQSASKKKKGFELNRSFDAKRAREKVNREDPGTRFDRFGHRK